MRTSGAALAEGVPARELRAGRLHGDALQPLPLREVLADVREPEGGRQEGLSWGSSRRRRVTVGAAYRFIRDPG